MSPKLVKIGWNHQNLRKFCRKSRWAHIWVNHWCWSYWSFQFLSEGDERDWNPFSHYNQNNNKEKKHIQVITQHWQLITLYFILADNCLGKSSHQKWWKAPWQKTTDVIFLALLPTFRLPKFGARRQNSSTITHRNMRKKYSCCEHVYDITSH